MHHPFLYLIAQPCLNCQPMSSHALMSCLHQFLHPFMHIQHVFAIVLSVILIASPALSILSKCSGSSMAFLKTAWSLWTMGSGMPLGPTMPRVEEEMTVGYPCSVVVETSGKNFVLSLSMTARVIG